MTGSGVCPHLDGRNDQEAASGQPRGHVPAVPCRYLFWTEWGQYPRIERSRLDGTERMVLVNVSISWPNGISVDYEVQPLAGRTVPRRGLAGSVLVPAVGLLLPLGTWVPSPGPWSLLSSAERVVQGGRLLNPGAFCQTGREVRRVPWRCPGARLRC